MLKAKSQRGRRRENGGRQIRFPGGGRGSFAESLRGPGGPPKRSATYITGSLGRAHREKKSMALSWAPLVVQKRRGSHVPSPTPAKGNGARRLRAGKALGQSGLRQRPLRNSSTPTATRVPAFPLPDHGGGWPVPTAVPAASPCPFL